MSWAIYADPGLTALADPVDLIQAEGGAAADFLVYLGNPVASRKLQKGSAPGVDAVTLALEDSAGGSGLATTVIRLAITAPALASATPGAALEVGTTLLSGVAGAVPIFVRVDVGAAADGEYTDLGFVLAGVVDSAV